ncbi:MAG: hypothetical protein DRI88_10450 [Bacteroidetes bacterium]|nr:MAG: hypothetical protein DRI88_10450 [Bacteroidota bacterium]
MKKNYSILTIIMLLGIILSISSCKKGDDTPELDPNATEFITNGNTVTVIDHGKGTGTMTFTRDKIWILSNLVFVNQGQTITIEAGTIIKGKPGQGENASALIVARGAKIQAEGTVNKPIIFTAEADDLHGSVSKTAKGLWGGVIILGAARMNTVPDKMNIEGIPTTEPRGEYGGSNDEDNSGVFKYVSIRHGGTNIGADNEINGLTLGAVGNKTVIEHIEVFANNDDGYEWFGGTVKTKYLISAYCKDDAFDWDQGYRGEGQFWLAVQDPDDGDRLGELDGADDPENGTPLGGGTVYNATFVGRGADAGKKTLTFRANGGGTFYNSIFVNQAKGVDIELKENLKASSSWKRFKNGELKIENNIFFDIADNTAENVFKVSVKDGVSSNDSIQAVQEWADYITTANNTVDTDPGITYPATGSFNPIPTGDVSGNLHYYPSDFFMQVSYKGAFDPNAANWAKAWTLLFEN